MTGMNRCEMWCLREKQKSGDAMGGGEGWVASGRRSSGLSSKMLAGLWLLLGLLGGRQAKNGRCFNCTSNRHSDCMKYWVQASTPATARCSPQPSLPLPSNNPQPSLNPPILQQHHVGPASNVTPSLAQSISAPRPHHNFVVPLGVRLF
ncbi:ATP-binding cassette [Cordyceps militaris]|uniref:ATP-binding cassette n=1 Tax=Cordyceps militaris TaxID=73501 RepID=A0A2H4SGS2_CORMI|nr:ATP-binding cassette [Cordyceps militaris]